MDKKFINSITLTTQMSKENKDEKDDVIVLDEKGDEEFDLGKDELDLSPDNDDDSDNYDYDSGD
jgi:hypothetical protein